MDYLTTFVNEFVNQICKLDHGLRQMKNFYIFEDKRPGTLEERFNFDSQQWAWYTKLIKGNSV